MELYYFLFTALGLILGYLIAYFRTKSNKVLDNEEVRILEEEREEAMQQVSKLEERNGNLSEQLNTVSREQKDTIQRANEGERRLAQLKADYRNLKERLGEQKEEMQRLQDHFKEEFENLANKILEQKTKKFTEQNKEKLDQLLRPLSKKLEEFKREVKESHKEDMKGRSALSQHLKQLKELNKQMGEEAQNLTSALKGDTQKQGSWGEVILERILERSGLRKNREYEVQVSQRDGDNQLKRPDAVVYLPDKKYMVIDSKMSLVAYERYASADDKEEKEQALKAHLNSIRTHIRDLSAKNYQHLFEKRSPDFVLMFIPIESAFGAAFKESPTLYNYAFERNIVIVSPTTLLATLATINNVWKREYQNQNAQKIAERGGRLYDKFALFVDSLEDVGMRIRQSQESYNTAMKRLKTGRGNLVGQANKLQKLGVSNSKELDDKYKPHPSADSDQEE